MVGPSSFGSHDATVVHTRRRAEGGFDGGEKRSRTSGWRVGTQSNSSLGTEQSAAPTFSPNVKNASWRRSVSTRDRSSGAALSLRYAGTDACVYRGSLSRNTTRPAAKYSSRIQHEAETCRNRSASRQNRTTSRHERPKVRPVASRKNQRSASAGSSAAMLSASQRAFRAPSSTNVSPRGS